MLSRSKRIQFACLLRLIFSSLNVCDIFTIPCDIFDMPTASPAPTFASCFGKKLWSKNLHLKISKYEINCFWCLHPVSESGFCSVHFRPGQLGDLRIFPKERLWGLPKWQDDAMWVFYTDNAFEISPDGMLASGIENLKAGWEQFVGMLDAGPLSPTSSLHGG